jgi:putative membrane protein
VRRGLLAAAFGGATLIALIGWFGIRSIGTEVLQAAWSIPGITALHLAQLFLSACAWSLAVGEPSMSLLTYFRLRTIREGVNSLLPVAQIGGQVVCVRLMAQLGVGIAQAGAGTILDLTLEAGMQLVFILLGIGMLAAAGINPTWASWAEGGLVVGVFGILGFVVAQRAGLLRLIEFLTLRLNHFWPALSVESVRGLHRELIRLQHRPWTLVKAALFHLTSWSLGAGEVYLVLLAIGAPVGLTQAFVIESLGMAARSAGFALPGALGVQEGGFILVCGLFGVSPDAAIALSMVKRLREVLIGIPGLIIWQWSEIKRRLFIWSVNPPPSA